MRPIIVALALWGTASAWAATTEWYMVFYSTETNETVSVLSSPFATKEECTRATEREHHSKRIWATCLEF